MPRLCIYIVLIALFNWCYLLRLLRIVFRALGEQLSAEFRNVYLYLAMAGFFAEKGLSGFSHFFWVQAREELGHTMKIYDYILDRGDRVVLGDVPTPKQSWDGVLSAVAGFVRSEEKLARDLLAGVKLVGDSSVALLVPVKELAKRKE